ncbi:hypothetical protein Q4595_27125, partial [Wenyingzhuangia sp. 1_MG-2023]|nr:hypothetical protein [Wenyingzhuangia sp. 1_MG-2023]
IGLDLVDFTLAVINGFEVLGIPFVLWMVAFNNSNLGSETAQRHYQGCYTSQEQCVEPALGDSGRNIQKRLEGR